MFSQLLTKNLVVIVFAVRYVILRFSMALDRPQACLSNCKLLSRYAITFQIVSCCIALRCIALRCIVM